MAEDNADLRKRRRESIFEVETKSTVRMSAELAAQWFAGVSDEEQAAFFVRVAELAREWRNGADGQWWYLGGHLRSCGCSSEDARQMLKNIVHAMEHSTHA